MKTCKRGYGTLIRFEGGRVVEAKAEKGQDVIEAQLDKDYKAFVATAQDVAPGKTPAQAMATLELEHPSADSLIPAAKSTVEGLRQFLIDHNIVDIPSSVRPIVTETPPYARATITLRIATDLSGFTTNTTLGTAGVPLTDAKTRAIHGIPPAQAGVDVSGATDSDDFAARACSSANRGAPAASGISASGTSSTSPVM